MLSVLTLASKWLLSWERVPASPMPQCGLVNGTVTGLDAAAGECVPCADASCIDCAADYQKCTQVGLWLPMSDE